MSCCVDLSWSTEEGSWKLTKCLNWLFWPVWTKNHDVRARVYTYIAWVCECGVSTSPPHLLWRSIQQPSTPDGSVTCRILIYLIWNIRRKADLKGHKVNMTGLRVCVCLCTRACVCMCMCARVCHTETPVWKHCYFSDSKCKVSNIRPHIANEWRAVQCKYRKTKHLNYKEVHFAVQSTCNVCLPARYNHTLNGHTSMYLTRSSDRLPTRTSKQFSYS